MSIGLNGLGKMGKNLALNISQGRRLHVYNRTPSKMLQLVENTDNISGYLTTEEFIKNIERPRSVIAMLPNGVGFDDMIVHMDKGDTILDCANEHYDVSVQKSLYCESHGIEYLGVGMSGGAQGALNGPAVMIGGRSDVFMKHKNFLNSICNNCVWVGPEADCGHFTKMVHNGIEYSMLQCIADIYSATGHNKYYTISVLKKFGGYLTNSAIEVFNKYDIEKIVDKCEMNGTGLWCSQYAYKHQLPLTTMHTAVQYRINSNNKLFKKKKNNYLGVVPSQLLSGSLEFVFALAFYEGLYLLEHKGINIERAQKAWSKSTIIESEFTEKSFEELELIMSKNLRNVRCLVYNCSMLGLSVPIISASLNYYEFMKKDNTQMSLVSAQRNYFGNHDMCFHNKPT